MNRRFPLLLLFLLVSLNIGGALSMMPYLLLSLKVGSLMFSIRTYFLYGSMRKKKMRFKNSSKAACQSVIMLPSLYNYPGLHQRWSPLKPRGPDIFLRIRKHISMTMWPCLGQPLMLTFLIMLGSNKLVVFGFLIS